LLQKLCAEAVTLVHMVARRCRRVGGSGWCSSMERRGAWLFNGWCIVGWRPCLLHQLLQKRRDAIQRRHECRHAFAAGVCLQHKDARVRFCKCVCMPVRTRRAFCMRSLWRVARASMFRGTRVGGAILGLERLECGPQTQSLGSLFRVQSRLRDPLGLAIETRSGPGGPSIK
jgi:hypothetical protein